MDYLKNSFNLSNTDLVLNGDYSTTVRAIVNHINSTQTLVSNVEVGFDPQLSDDDFKFILQNVSATENFFQIQRIDSCEKRRNFRNLLTSDDNEEIYVDGSNSKTEDLKRFLKEWKSGKFPKLKKVALETKVTCMNYLDVTNGSKRMRDKCDYSYRRREMVAIKGQGNLYGIVNPDENRNRT
ncbi:hypothetical protein CAEBREN_02475 [Caenorhabditis brenneri]|uniref:Sdz-33 F-box domain-containing protein n=1 Tax=Caenorhabditis brenneri TaxID=135651 RepID=G0NJX7_CAEBE|nr:hypothetical protein CAEBREN_02475 [Caenorhabditis brenneri]